MGKGGVLDARSGKTTSTKSNGLLVCLLACWRRCPATRYMANEHVSYVRFFFTSSSCLLVYVCVCVCGTALD